ncbi:MAG: carboxypeptidase-like regulatory domain-containing protein [Paludibacteraceae bacterium]|nr:carboxypeptidase-like regulatory domain-containing protein [Paludibacteraceae bacterium]
MKKLVFILLGLCILLSRLWAIDYGSQETIVVGDVYDAYTGEALPNVNIYIQGTTIGTMSNAEGMFLLRGYIDRQRTMVVSAVGYNTERVRIEAGQQVGIDVALKEKVGNLGDVFVYPGANPALPLMDNVRRHKQNNERVVNLDQANTLTALYVSDIQSNHLQRNLWKSLQAGMLQQEDSTFLIPLYWRQQYADQIEEKATLLTLTDYQVLLNQLQSYCNFYDNNVNILSASLLSPLAASGNTYYNYYLADSVLTDKEKHYLVHFRSKNVFYPTFNGEMLIDSATYALRSMRATIPAKSNINFLRQLTIQQQFDADNQLQQENMSLLLDFAIKADTSRIFPTLLLTRNTQLDDEAKTQNHELVREHEQRANVIASAMDSVSNTPLFKTAKFLAYVLQTGCIPTNKYVEVGKIHHLLRYNYAEGLRLGIPLRTTAELWEQVSLEVFVAHSTGDRAWKGMGQVNIALPAQRRHILRMRYSDEYVLSDVSDFQLYLRENNVLSPQINILTRLMQVLPSNQNYYFNTMARRREGKIHFENDWNKYLETQSYLKIGRLGYGMPTTNYHAQPSFAYATFGTSVRISFNERKVDSYFHRRHIYNHLPVVYLGAELGSYQTQDMLSYRMYGNLQLMIRHKLNLGMAGYLDYLLQAGLIFGRVPYPLLHIFAANQTYAFDAHRFTLMNTYQYAADQYISLQASWNGRGVVFNSIPGLRYLRLHELLEVKVAYGGMRNNHQSVIPFPTSSLFGKNQANDYPLLSAPTKPYVELGVGIGNILRVAEVYGVFRLTDIHNPHTPWWGVRFRFWLGL